MWRLNGTNASLESSELSCWLDVARPEKGVRDLCLQSDRRASASVGPSALWKLAFGSTPSSIAECYTRGPDLVARYEQTEQRPFTVQVYWRFLSAHECLGIELVISVQTNQLDCRPQWSLFSDYPVRPVFVEGDVALSHAERVDWCYAELIDPSNFGPTSLGENRIEHPLFPGHLEKGVIRRARLRGLFLPASNAQKTAAALRREFIESAPPLTA